jgi:hypothetical protein
MQKATLDTMLSVWARDGHGTKSKSCRSFGARAKRTEGAAMTRCANQLFEILRCDDRAVVTHRRGSPDL